MNESINQNSSRNRHYMVDLKRYYRMPAVQASVTTVLSILIVAFFIMVAIRPTFVTIAKLKKSIEDSDKTLKLLQTKEKAVQQAAQIYESLSDSTDYIETSIPSTGAEYDKFIKSVEILANQSGVVLSSETLGNALLYSEIVNPYTGKSRGIVKMPLSLKVTGLYPQVREFLRQVANMDRIMEVDNITISRDTTLKNATDVNVSMSITGNISYIADQKALDTILQKDKK